MKSDEGLAAAFFSVVMAGAVALAIANDITAPICKAAAEAVPKDKFDFGCLEYWVNRYQSALAAALSIAVALLVARPAFKQLVESNRQTSASARAMLMQKIETYTDELRLLSEISQAAGLIEGALKGIAILGEMNPRSVEFYDKLNVAGKRIIDSAEALRKFLRSEPRLTDRTALRGGLYRRALELAKTSGTFARKQKQVIYDRATGPNDYPAVSPGLITETRWLDSAQQALSNQLLESVAAAWTEIHELEDLVRNRARAG